jgi:hypothetical protein
MVPDSIKISVILFGYLVASPLLGWVISRNKSLMRYGLCLMFFMTSWFPARITLMAHSIETYRGHTKGFEGSLFVCLGMAMTLAALLDKKRGCRLWPPGMTLYLLFCAAGTLSIVNAMNDAYVLMATFRYTSAAFVFAAAHYAFEDEATLKWIIRTLAASLILQALVCLKMRYVDGRFQVMGWFEHQNSLAMWAYTCALPVLAFALSSKTSRKESLFYFGAFAATGIMIILTVSRAALAAYALGTMAVWILCAIRDWNKKLWLFGAAGLCAACLIAVRGLNGLNSRLESLKDAKEEIDLRGILIIQAKTMLQDHWLGVGWNNYGLANSEPDGQYACILEHWAQGDSKLHLDLFEREPLPESYYWLLLAELGYPGFICNVAFMALCLWWTLACTKRYWNSRVLPLVFGLMVVMLLYLGHCTVERILTQSKNITLWLLFAGCLARLYSMRPRAITKS